MDNKQMPNGVNPNLKNGTEAKTTATPRRIAWVRKTNRRLRWLRGGIVVACGMLLVLGLLLLILPTFQVKEIVVEGNSVTSTEAIIAASGIQMGTEIIGTDWSVAMANIEASCPVKVTKLVYTATKVKITVEELERAYMAYGDVFVSMDKDFTAMRISENEADFEGILKIRLPAIVGVNAREALLPVDPSTDLAYVTTLLDWLEERELTDSVTLLDASDKLRVFLVQDGKYRIVFGRARDLDDKLEAALAVLREKADADAFASVDVTDSDLSVYRPVSSFDELIAG